MFCKECGTKLNQNQPCQNCFKKSEEKGNKLSFKEVLEVIVYIIFILFIFLSWGVRRDIIVGPIPVLIHLGILYLIYLLIKKMFN